MSGRPLELIMVEIGMSQIQFFGDFFPDTTFIICKGEVFLTCRIER